jgi:hypothetical protein
VSRTALILTAKIRRVFITDAETGAGYVQIFAKHHTARFMKPELFLKLQRAHCRDALEMMVKSGNAHAEFARHILNLERLVNVFAELFDCLGNAASLSFGN